MNDKDMGSIRQNLFRKNYRFFALYFHRFLDKFSLLSVPKVGSSNIREWSAREGLKSGPGRAGEFFGEVYSFWRRPSERIMSGLATDMNWLAYARGGLPKTFAWNYEEHRDLYLDTIRQWCSSPRLSPLRLGDLVCPFSHHEKYQNFMGIHRVDHFVACDQIALLPAYLNKKYLLNFGAIAQGPDRNQVGWMPTSVFVDILSRHPRAHDLVLRYIEQDTFRPSLLDLSAS